MRRETIEMFSRGLPLWQRLLVPTLVPGVVCAMEERFRLKEEMSANMKVIEKTFRQVDKRTETFTTTTGITSVL